MKRFTRIVALILVLVTVFTAPASAMDISNDSMINVLDYCTPNNSGYYTVNFNSGDTATFEFQGMFYYIDMIVSHSAQNIIGAMYISSAGHTSTLSVLPIGEGLFRIYGDLPGVSVGSFDIQLFVPSYSAVTFNRVSVYKTPVQHVRDIGTIQTNDGQAFTMTTEVSFVSAYTFSAFDLYCSNWKKYDYIDFVFYIPDVDWGISSIVARCSSFAVPFQISYLDSVGNAIDQDQTPVNSKFIWCVVRIDCRGLDRTIAYLPYVHVEFEDQSVGGDVYLQNCTGYIESETINPLFYYFDYIRRWIASYISWLGEKLGDQLDVLHTDFANFTTDFSNFSSALQERQDAYHDDLEEWNYENQQNLSALFKSVTDILMDVSADLKSIHSTILVEFDSLWSNIESRSKAFQSSMENYLDQLPARIAEEIAKIFKPTEGKFEAAKDESQELAEEKLGAVYQSAVVIDQIAGAFTVQTPQTSIVIPLVSVEVLPGVPFEFGGWDVPIVPAGLEFLIDTLKYVIDIVCTLAFLNGMKRRLDGFFGGESGVD